MNPITQSFLNTFNMLKRRQNDLETSNQELEMLNSVSTIFSKNKPMILTVHTSGNDLMSNKKFIQAVEELEKYHTEEEKITTEKVRIFNLQKELNAARNKVNQRKTLNTKLQEKLTKMFNTNNQENFLLTPQMQITFKLNFFLIY